MFKDKITSQGNEFCQECKAVGLLHKMLTAKKVQRSDDEELEEFLKASLPNIYVVGVGGSGGNSLDRMNQTGIEGAIMIAMNTDAQALLKIRADKKMLIGKKTTEAWCRIKP